MPDKEKKPAIELKYSESYYIRKLLTAVKIQEIMTVRVISVDVDEPFSHVAEKMREYNIRHVPIVNTAGELVGIVTQRDLYRVQSPRKDEDGNWFYDKQGLDNHILKHTMTPEPFSLKPTDNVATALLAMVEHKYGCIPIVAEKNILCGIVTQVDVLKIAAAIIKE